MAEEETLLDREKKQILRNLRSLTLTQLQELEAHAKEQYPKEYRESPPLW